MDIIIEENNIDHMRKFNELESSTDQKFSDMNTYIDVNKKEIQKFDEYITSTNETSSGMSSKIEKNENKVNLLASLPGEIEMIKTAAAFLSDRVTGITENMGDYSILTSSITNIDLKVKKNQDDYTSKLNSISSDISDLRNVVSDLAGDLILYSDEVKISKQIQSRLSDRVD